MKDSWTKLEIEITACGLCPRLVKHRETIAKLKKKEFREWAYWGRPVPSFGDKNARIWILGLAPAAHGANRTGRMFTGDSSGNWLYKALHRVGFANQPTSVSKEDGLQLKNVFISASAHCAPPDNKPTPKEIENCAPYLDREWALLKNITHFLVLGRIALQSLEVLLVRQGYKLPKPRWEFRHGASYQIDGKTIFISYHPSRQNTQTGRLTEKMWNEVFEKLKEDLN